MLQTQNFSTTPEDMEALFSNAIFFYQKSITLKQGCQTVYFPNQKSQFG
jgi:hypothetical protein